MISDSLFDDNLSFITNKVKYINVLVIVKLKKMPIKINFEKVKIVFENLLEEFNSILILFLLINKKINTKKNYKNYIIFIQKKI